MNIKQLNNYDEPRNRILNLGAENLTSSELLALIIRNGNKDLNAIELANNILEVIDLNTASINQLCKVEGVGIAKASSIVAAFELFKRISNENVFNDRFKINVPRDAFKYISKYSFNFKQEEFYVICLNSRKEVLGSKIIFKGTIDASIIHPREIFQYAIEMSSSYVIIAHNHPSGNLIPSVEDIEVTRKLDECGNILNIKVLDHIIFSGTDYISLKEEEIF